VIHLIAVVVLHAEVHHHVLQRHPAFYGNADGQFEIIVQIFYVFDGALTAAGGYVVVLLIQGIRIPEQLRGIGGASYIAAADTSGALITGCDKTGVGAFLTKETGQRAVAAIDQTAGTFGHTCQAVCAFRIYATVKAVAAAADKRKAQGQYGQHGGQ